MTALSHSGIYSLVGIVVLIGFCLTFKAIAAKRVSHNLRREHGPPLRNPDGSFQPVEAGPEGVGRGGDGADNPTPYEEHRRDPVLVVPKPAHTESGRERDLEIGLGGSIQGTNYAPPPAYSPPAYSPFSQQAYSPPTSPPPQNAQTQVYAPPTETHTGRSQEIQEDRSGWFGWGGLNGRGRDDEVIR